MPSSVGFAMVFSTNKSQQQVREQWNKSGQIQGHGQQRNRADVQHPLRRGSHSEGVFLAGGDNSVELRA